MTSLEPTPWASNPEAYVEQVVQQYVDFVNPGLASLMKFAGFGDVEVEGEGCFLRTATGAEYLDCLASYGVFALGHRHPKVVAAVHAQLDRMPLSSRTFFNGPQAELAERLAGIAPGNLQYSFFSNSGTEAVEAALKMARAATGRTNIVATIDAYHGKTFGGLSATGREGYRKRFEPLVPGFGHAPFNDAEALRAAVDQDTAAVILEPVQGEGGIHVAEAGYLQAAREICDSAGALLILDEVQTGMGRTGKMFAAEHWEVNADIMCLAKALGGGVMPIGATMGTPEVWQKVFGENPLLHTSTFGGNPLACSAANAAIQVLVEEDLAAASSIRGEQMLAGLRQVQAAHPGALKAVRGLGLMIGIEFQVKDVAELCINSMARRGVIAAYTLNNPKVIRIEPPLIITEAQVNRVVDVVNESVAESVEMLAGFEE